MVHKARANRWFWTSVFKCSSWHDRSNQTKWNDNHAAAHYPSRKHLGLQLCPLPTSNYAYIYRQLTTKKPKQKKTVVILITQETCTKYNPTYNQTLGRHITACNGEHQTAYLYRNIRTFTQHFLYTPRSLCISMPHLETKPSPFLF